MMEFAKARPEMFWSIVGAAVGAIAGLFVGGVGIAAGGRATGVSSLVVLIIFAAIGGLTGNRLGIAIGRHHPHEQKASNRK
jgi:hypothetical protein